MHHALRQQTEIADLSLRASSWFQGLQARICAAFEGIEETFAQNNGGTPGSFEPTPWLRGGEGAHEGGGTMALMRGQVFEKVGVNFSEVWGEFTPAFCTEIPGAAHDPRFWASGISLVAHMASPHVPAVHMNTRHIITTKAWFGGGADLTPMYPNPQDTQDFHDAFRIVCDGYESGAYDRYKDWCDRYFYLKHREEPRGVGGIFYDDLNSGNLEKDFTFTQNVGEAFLNVYPTLVRRHMDKPFTAEERAHQLQRRGRYVEFNLLYDRGTRFGLATGGNVEAILMSLPPVVHWP